MKKLTLLTVLIVGMLAFTGCKKENISIKSSDIQVNTMLVKKNGVVQVATVEEFKETYYDVTELEQYIEKEIKAYNTKVGNETAIVLDSLKVVKDNAIMILEYANMDYYAGFNEVQATYIQKVSESDLVKFPENFSHVGEEGSISKENVLGKNDVKAIIINEPYDLMVSGKIKYYSNGTIVNNKKIQTNSETQTIVIYE